MRYLKISQRGGRWVLRTTGRPYLEFKAHTFEDAIKLKDRFLSHRDEVSIGAVLSLMRSYERELWDADLIATEFRRTRNTLPIYQLNLRPVEFMWLEKHLLNITNKGPAVHSLSDKVKKERDRWLAR